MNIAFVGPDDLSIVLFCRGIIRSLKSIPDSKVFVICDIGRYKAEIDALGVTTVSVPMYRWMNPWEDARYCARLVGVMRQKEIEVVINFTTKANIYGAIAERIARVKKVIMHIVGLGSGFAGRRDFSGRMVRWIFVRLYRLACQLSDKVWFTNQRDREYFVSEDMVSASNAVLSRNYLDTSEYAPDVVCEQDKLEARTVCGVKAHDKVVIMVARMIWQKGIREYAEAAEMLVRSQPELKFLLVAPLETASRDAVPESYIREKEKTANFKWLGFQEDVKRLYAISDLAVLPTYYREGGYPRGLLEPMAMGKPVITTTSEDCRNTVEEGRNGLLVPPQDSKALALAIQRIVSSDELRKSMGEYSRVKAVRDFDERSIVNNALQELGLPVAIQD
jgi:glycosyltransferase involved in cell wall biosynthesis